VSWTVASFEHLVRSSRVILSNSDHIQESVSVLSNPSFIMASLLLTEDISYCVESLGHGSVFFLPDLFPDKAIGNIDVLKPGYSPVILQVNI
jgi:hypothetical protein